MRERTVSIAIGVVFVLIIGGLVVFMPTETRGNPGTIYVDDDADPSWYDATHVHTIQEGINAAVAGDTVFVYNGTYYENVVVNKQLTLIGEDRNGTIIDGGGSGDVVYITADWVNFTGFTVQNSESYPYAGISLKHNYRCHIENNTFINNYGYGVFLHSTNRIILIDNIIESNVGGIFLQSSSINNNIFRNRVSNNSGFGIEIGASHHNIIMSNSVIKNSRGIGLFSSTANTITNNTMSDNSIFLYGPSLIHWNTHTIDTSNTVNGKPIHYLKDVNGGIVPSNAGEVILANCTNVTVKNQNLSNGTIGVQLGFSFNNTISDNTISHNRFGIHLGYSNTNNFTHNNISNNDDGMLLFYSSNNTISDNTISHNSFGIQLGYSNTNNFTHNNISNNDKDGIFLHYYCRTNNFFNNVIDNNRRGLHLYLYGNNNTIFKNNISSNKQCGIFLLKSTSNCKIKNNNITNNVIRLEYVSNCTISGNIVSKNSYNGIDLYHSNNCTISGNSIVNNVNGIWLGYSSNCTITGNTASYNDKGVTVRSSSSNTISGNIITNNSLEGIHLCFSSNFNLIYSNYFNNTHNAYDEGDNTWNISKTPGTNIIGGPYLGGNYWSDYSGIDIDGDGLGDTELPYNSLGGIQNGGDWHPLTDVNTMDVGIIDSSIHDGDTRFIGSDSLSVTVKNLGTIATSVMVNLTLEWWNPATSDWVEVDSGSQGPYELDPEAWVESFFDVSYDVEGEYRATFSLDTPLYAGWSDADPSNDVYQATFTVISPNQPPVADFTYTPREPIRHETIQFEDQSYDRDGTIVNWTWDFGDGQGSYEQHPSHQYSRTGTYTVTLTVMDDDYEYDSVSRRLTVYPHSSRDHTPPETTISFLGPYYTDIIHRWISPETLIVFTATDYGDGYTSGVDRTMYKLDNGSYVSYSEPFTIPIPGKHTLYYYSVDNARNYEGLHAVTLYVDDQPPIVEMWFEQEGEAYVPYTNDDGYHCMPPGIHVCLVANDTGIPLPSGLQNLLYRIDRGMWQNYTDPIVFDHEGDHVFEYAAIDHVQNEVSSRMTIVVDDSPPETTTIVPLKGYLYVFGRAIIPLPLEQTIIIGGIDVTYEGTDATGIQQVEFYVDGDLMYTAEAAPFVWTWDSFVIGYRTLELVATDHLGHSTTEKMTVLRFNL